MGEVLTLSPHRPERLHSVAGRTGEWGSGSPSRFWLFIACCSCSSLGWPLRGETLQLNFMNKKRAPSARVNMDGKGLFDDVG